MSTAHRIPYEIIREIIGFVPDIEVRRSFGIIGKIKQDNTSYMKYVIRKPAGPWRWPEFTVPPPVRFDSYLLPNRCVLGMRGRKPVADDTIDISIHVSDTTVTYCFYMFRLRPKKDSEEKTVTGVIYDGVEYVGEYMHYKYVRC